MIHLDKTMANRIGFCQKSVFETICFWFQNVGFKYLNSPTPVDDFIYKRLCLMVIFHVFVLSSCQGRVGQIKFDANEGERFRLILCPQNMVHQQKRSVDILYVLPARTHS